MIAATRGSLFLFFRRKIMTQSSYDVFAEPWSVASRSRVPAMTPENDGSCPSFERRMHSLCIVSPQRSVVGRQRGSKFLDKVRPHVGEPEAAENLNMSAIA